MNMPSRILLKSWARKENHSFYSAPEISTKAQRRSVPRPPSHLHSLAIPPAQPSAPPAKGIHLFSALPLRAPEPVGSPSSLENIFLDWKATPHNVCSPACCFLSSVESLVFPWLSFRISNRVTNHLTS